VQPVFDTIVDRALRLCDGLYSGVYLLDGELLRLVVHNQTGTEAEATLRSGYPRPLSREGLIGRAILERRVIHVSDVQSDPDASEWSRSRSRLLGFRSFLGVPMLREGRPIGAIRVNRSEPRPFSDREIALLRVFADQAVIAIENMRLFQALEARNRDLTATSEILQVISRSPTDVRPVLDTVVEHAGRLCSARDAQIFRREGEHLRLVAHHGPIPSGPVGEFTMPISRGTVNGRSVLEQRPVQVADLRAESAEFPHGQAIALKFGHRTVLTVPLMRAGVAIGTLSVRRAEVRPFTDAQAGLLQTFADQAVIAIENVRLFTELQEKNRALTQAHAQVTEALEQQTATADVLKVISRSTFDLQPVLETLIESAARPCGADKGFILRPDGDLYRSVAAYGATPEFIEIAQRNPIRPGRESATGRAVLERRVIQIPDVLADPEYAWATGQRGDEIRTILAVPMLREATVVGVIVIRRTEVQPSATNRSSW
jgi:two-component system NtrC family sensor kinase